MARWKNFGEIPKVVAVIGETPVHVSSVSITLTNKSESDEATLEIPLENIDSSVFTQKGKYYAVQIYAGYIDDGDEKDFSTIKESSSWEDLLKNKKYEQVLFKRFDGFVDQPEWQIGEKRMLTLHCKDAAGLLMDGRFSEKKEGNEASAKSVIAKIQANVKGVKIIFDSKDFQMGRKDSNGEKVTYNIANKTYWDVIKDVAERGNLNIKKEGTTIKLTKQEQWKRKWTMVMSSTKDPQKDWTNFKNINIRYGKAGSKSKENILVEVLCHTPAKKRGKARAIVGRFPSSSKGWSGDENTDVIRIHLKYPLTQAEATAKARNIAEEQLRGFITGDVDVPFANPEILVDEGICFQSDKNYGLEFLAGKVFRIDSINEEFSSEGYSQTIEFESNPRFEQPERVAPKNVDTKNEKQDRGFSTVGNFYG
jgi:hypothetical protein